MSCIALTTRLLSGIGVSASEAADHPLLMAAGQSPAVIGASVSAICTLRCAVSSPLRLQAAVVCAINERAYLIVSPEETQWLAPWGELDYQVTSNTDWSVDH